MKPEEIAQKLGIKYDGTWEGYTNSPTMYQFTDPLNEATFLVRNLEEVPDRLEKQRRSFGMTCPIKKFDAKDLERAAAGLEIDPNDYPGLLEGMQVELEHCDFTQGDPVVTARIALAHLNETPDYYKKLKLWETPQKDIPVSLAACHDKTGRIRAQAISEHWSAIKQAIKEGKTIPPEVLHDYETLLKELKEAGL